PKPFHTLDLLEKIRTLLTLTWRQAGSRSQVNGNEVPLPERARAALQEHLAHGDLEAFRAELARQRSEHPQVGPRWQELDDAAAGFQLSRLRQLLDDHA